MKGRKLSARLIALVGLLSAVALVFLLAAGVIPAGWTGVTAVAGLVVGVAISAAGYLSGLFCYLVSGVLALMLVPGKHVALLYLCLFGIYPLLKNKLEHLKSRALEYLLKLIFFNLVLALLYSLAYTLLFQPLEAAADPALLRLPVLMLVGSVIFLLYDFAFSKVMALLQARLVPQLRHRFHEC